MVKVKDITGQRFGRLLVFERSEDRISKSGRKIIRWKCQCDCGNIIDVDSSNLLRGNTRSCGCLTSENKKQYYIGKKFGRLTVIERIENYIDENGSPHSMWKCKCECGNVVSVRGTFLKSGSVRSCGCLGAETLKEMLTVHGDSKTRLYKIWAGIKERCYNANNKCYKEYGGRGILMCDEWKNDYVIFKEWAYANGYYEDVNKEPCSIDRIDNNGNYCPNNCRWVNRKVQQNNTRHNHYIEYNNETHTIAEWADIYKIDYKQFYNRLKCRKWDFEETLNTFEIG